LKEKKEAIDEIKVKEENLQMRFNEICPEDKPNHELLLNRFRKISK
jgi:hypothetical protein